MGGFIMKRILLITALSLVGQFGLATEGSSDANGRSKADLKKLRDYVGGNFEALLCNFLRKDKERDKILERILANNKFEELILRKNRYGKIELVAKKKDGESVFFATNYIDLPSPYGGGVYIFEDNSNWDYILSDSFSWKIGIWGIAAITCNKKILKYAEETGKKPKGIKCKMHLDGSPSDCERYPYDGLTPSEIHKRRNVTSVDFPIVAYKDILDEYEDHFCRSEDTKKQYEYVKKFKPIFLKACNESCNQ